MYPVTNSLPSLEDLLFIHEGCQCADLLWSVFTETAATAFQRSAVVPRKYLVEKKPKIWIICLLKFEKLRPHTVISTVFIALSDL